MPELPPATVLMEHVNVELWLAQATLEALVIVDVARQWVFPWASTSYTSIVATFSKNNNAIDISSRIKSQSKLRISEGLTGFVLISLGIFRKGRRIMEPEAYKSGGIASKAEI